MEKPGAAGANSTPEGVDAEGPDAVAYAAGESLLDALAGVREVDPATLTADGLLHYVGLLGTATRFLEGRQVFNVGDIGRRSDTDAGFEGLAARHGSASPTALFEKITGAKNSTAYRYSKLAKHTTARVSDTGLSLEPVFVQTAQALSEGVIGLDAAEAITSTLAPVLSRAIPEEVDRVEATLLGNATGAYGEVPVSADNLRLQARAFCVVLDPDGVEPTAEELHQARKLVFRHQDDGTLKITGTLSPEQAAVVSPVFDAFMSKRTSPKFMETAELESNGEAAESRSKSQERADVFTAIAGGTGKQDAAPKLHGRGPTVLVTVEAENLEAGTGAAWSPGTPAPLPMSFVKQMRCDGDTHQVTIDDNGNVLDLGDAERLFTPKQRLALIARDGTTCAAPDCPIPAWLCEAHHVHGWANGGPTNLANGIILCWFHHRLIERGEWIITRDNHGHPKLVPPGWYVNRRYLGTRHAPRRREQTENTGQNGTNLPNSDTPSNDSDPPDHGREPKPRT